MWKLKLAKYYFTTMVIAMLIIPALASAITGNKGNALAIGVFAAIAFILTFPVVLLIYITSKIKDETLSLIYFIGLLAWAVLVYMAYILYTEPFLGGSWG
jgi:Mn2+/Fe2+ NRAMP family transporter